MKGIILNLLQTVTEEVHGEQAWDDLLQSTRVDGAYTSLGDYPDSDVSALVTALAQRTASDDAAVLQWFGRLAIPHMRRRYPAFFAAPDPVSLVLTLEDVIHSEVFKLHPDATPPTMTFSDVTPTSVTIDYRSQRALSDLGIGLLHGVADAYGQVLEITRLLIDPTGAHVSLHCRFQPT